MSLKDILHYRAKMRTHSDKGCRFEKYRFTQSHFSLDGFIFPDGNYP